MERCSKCQSCCHNREESLNLKLLVKCKNFYLRQQQISCRIRGKDKPNGLSSMKIVTSRALSNSRLSRAQVGSLFVYSRLYRCACISQQTRCDKKSDSHCKPNKFLATMREVHMCKEVQAFDDKSIR